MNNKLNLFQGAGSYILKSQCCWPLSRGLHFLRVRGADWVRRDPAAAQEAPQAPADDWRGADDHVPEHRRAHRHRGQQRGRGGSKLRPRHQPATVGQR